MVRVRKRKKRRVVILDKMLENISNGEKELSIYESKRRNELIEEGLKECRELIGKQKSEEKYYFYEGSIDGFNECRLFNSFSDFETRLIELQGEELREISKSSLKDKHLRELHHLYDTNEETDLGKVWKLKGIRTQVNFVYDRLRATRIIIDNAKKTVKQLKKSKIKFEEQE